MKELVIALDAIPKEQALEIAKKLTGEVWGFKVNDLLIEYGVSIITELRKYGEVFADPKLYDTPNTVFNSVEVLGRAGAKIVTVHATGGQEMLEYALKASKVYNLTIAAVTTVTSLSEDAIRYMYRGFPLQRFSQLLQKVGVKCVVCAGAEAEIYRSLGYKTIVPGFRPFGPLNFDDQKRSTNIVESDYLVIGRPVIQNIDPLKAVKEIKEKFRAF